MKGLNPLSPFRRARRGGPAPDRAPAPPAGPPPGPPPGADWRVVAPVGLLRTPVPLPCGLGAFRRGLEAWRPAPLVTADGRLLPRGVPLALTPADYGALLTGVAVVPEVPLMPGVSSSPIPPLPGTGAFAPAPPAATRRVERRSDEYGHEGGTVEDPGLPRQGNGADRRAWSEPGASAGIGRPEPRAPGPASDPGSPPGRQADSEPGEAGALGSPAHGRRKATGRPGSPVIPGHATDGGVRSEPFVPRSPDGSVRAEGSRGPDEVSVRGLLRNRGHDGDALGHHEAHRVGSRGPSSRDGDRGLTPQRGPLHRQDPSDEGGADGGGPASGPEQQRAQRHQAEAPSTSWAPWYRRSRPDRGSTGTPGPPEVLGHHPDRPGRGDFPGLRLPWNRGHRRNRSGKDAADGPHTAKDPERHQGPPGQDDAPGHDLPQNRGHRQNRSDKDAADGPSTTEVPEHHQDQPHQDDTPGYDLPWNLRDRQNRPHRIAAAGSGPARHPEHHPGRPGPGEVSGPGSPGIPGHAEPRGGHSETRGTPPQGSARPPGRQDHDAFLSERSGDRQAPGGPPGPNPSWDPGRSPGPVVGRDRGDLPPAAPRHRLGVGRPLPRVPGTAMPFVIPPPAGNEQPPGPAAGAPSTTAPSFAFAPPPAPAPRTAHDPAPPDAAAIAREVAQEVVRRHAGLLAEAVVPALGLSRRTRRAAVRWQSPSPPAPPPTEGSPWGTYPPR
ncbi:hypothetical protein SNS2_5261 [Streptomyces netropsis]|nr:hypothetical protein SNS2_5261 [Streptomyces netropsis]